MSSIAVQDVEQGVSDAVQRTVSVVPKVILFLVILLVGWLVARAVSGALRRLLTKVGFDRAVERGGLGAAFSQTTMSPSTLLARIAYYALLLLTLQLAFGVFGPNPISDLIASIVAFLPKIFVAIIIVVVAAAIARVVKDLVLGALGGSDLGRWLATAAQLAIVVVGAVAALTQIGIAVLVTNTVLVAVLATVGGILVVGVGGGLIRPMQRRWERWLEAAEHHTAEASRARAAAARHARVEAEHPVPSGGPAAAPAPEPLQPSAPPPPTAPVSRPAAEPPATATSPALGEPEPPGASDETQRIPRVRPDQPGGRSTGGRG